MHALLRPFPTPRQHELAVFVLRGFFAFVLIYGTQDNVFSTERMHEFRDFLAGNGFPYPLASAYLSAYAQFVCGLLILSGTLTRAAAVVMIVNFVVALLMVHVRLPFSANIAPLAMLSLAIYFTMHGAGRLSVDERLWRGRAEAPATNERELRDTVTT